MPFVNQNPFTLPEIVENILKYLDFKELRQTRRVNRTWYSISHHFGSCTKLNAGPGGNLQQYISFLDEHEWWKQWKLKYHIQVVIDENQDATPFFLGVLRLQEIFGPSCFQVFTVYCKSTKEKKGSTATGYKNFGGELWNENLLKLCSLLQNIDLSFLKQLYIVDLHVATSTFSVNLATLFINIINSTSGLTKLSFKNSDSRCAVDYDTFDGGEALPKILRATRSENISNVEQLEFMNGLSGQAERSMKELIFPRLTSLKCHTYFDWADMEFLELNSSRLTSLEVSFQLQHSFIFSRSYPVLPMLSHFGCFQKVYKNTAIHDKFDSISSSFTSLESFSTNIIYIMLPSSTYKWLPKTKEPNVNVSHVITVRKFTLIIDEKLPLIFGKGSNYQLANQEALLHGIQLVKTTFPNLVELVIKNEHCIKDTNIDLERQVLRMLLESVSGIEILRLENYNEDWLIFICRSSGVATEHMQSIRQIIIPPLDANFQRKFNSSRSSLVEEAGGSPSKSQPNFDISTLLKYLPKLEMIQFPFEFDIGLGTTTSSSEERKLAEINKLRAKYTNLEITFLNC